jgi:PhnB protein
MTEQMTTGIIPMLSLRNAAKAIDFYERAFGAREVLRSTAPDGRIVAQLAIADAGDAIFGLVDEATQVGNTSPETLGGTSVRISLLVADPDAVAQRAVEAGAEVMFPIADQPYGMRQGRLVDPFGHHWLIGRPL